MEASTIRTAAIVRLFDLLGICLLTVEHRVTPSVESTINGEALWEAAGQREVCGGCVPWAEQKGDVSGELVFAGQAMPEDFARLEREGLSVRGKIVLVPHCGNCRGMGICFCLTS